MSDETRVNLERYLAGALPPTVAAAFLAEIKGDAEALAYLGRALRQQAMLFSVHRLESQPASGRQRARSWWPGRRALAWAAAVALLVGLAGWFLGRHGTKRDILAQVESIRGEVFLEVADRTGRLAAQAGQDLHGGARLRTTGPDSAAVIVYADGTRLTTRGPTDLRLAKGATPGKYIWLEQGEIEGAVAKQPAGQALVLETALTETRVLGTRFRLTSTASDSRLVVDEGLVQFTRKSDGVSVAVTAQQRVVAEAEGPLVARPARVVSGLVALYPFDEGQGNTLHDHSGVGTPAELKLPEPSGLQWVPGGLRIDPVIGGGALPEPIRLKLGRVTDITLEMWVQWEGGTDERPHHYVLTGSTDGPVLFFRDAALPVPVTPDPSWTTAFLRGMQQHGSLLKAKASILRLLAVYDRSLTPAEVKHNLDAGPD